MFKPRTIRSASDWLDADGAKLYTISADGSAVHEPPFRARMLEVKASRPIPWPETAHFAIFHQGSSYLYLIVAWWGNDNELFTSVSVLTASGWVEQPDRYSFCLYDLEIFWIERSVYIETMYSGPISLPLYRENRRLE